MRREIVIDNGSSKEAHTCGAWQCNSLRGLRGLGGEFVVARIKCCLKERAATLSRLC